jgi:hypothetical protein
MQLGRGGVRGEITVCRTRLLCAETTQAGYGGVLGLVSIIVLFVPAPSTAPLPESAARKGCAVAAHSGKAATTYPSYLHTAEVADILHVSPKTVSRWAKEGKLPS